MKVDSTKLRNYRLKASAVAILHYLDDISVDDLIFSIYLPIKDDDTKKLIAFYEEQLLTAKLKGKEFVDLRPRMIRKVVEWVHKNKKWQLFADFVMYVQRNLERLGQTNDVLNAYMTSLMDTWTMLSPFGKYWYGLDEQGKPLYMDELYGPYDWEGYLLYEEMKKVKDKKIKEFKYLPKVIELEQKIGHIQMNERNITNIIFDMIGMINPKNEKFIFPEKWFDHCRVILDLPRQAQTNEWYLDHLDKRQYLLATEGVVVKCYNSTFISEIRFKEEFLEDGMLVLFRVTDFKGDSTMGFIDVRDKYTYAIGKHSNKTQYNKDFLNFILEVYCNLTCDLENPELNIIDSPNEAILDTSRPSIFADVYQEDTLHLVGHSGSKKAIQKVLHNVRPFLRKGNPSENAKAFAKLYGIVLPQGYTFVREHVRGKDKIG